MSDTYTTTLAVAPEAIDANGHVNNREYLRWMQDVAVAHSAAVGWPMRRYFREGATWVVRSHYVEYLRPAYQADELEAHTWVATMEEHRSLRRYLFWRPADGTVVARAETLWVFVDLEKGRPRRIPDALRSDFPLVDATAAEVGIRLAG